MTSNPWHIRSRAGGDARALRLSSPAPRWRLPRPSRCSELTAEAEQVETLMRDYLVEDAVAG